MWRSAAVLCIGLSGLGVALAGCGDADDVEAVGSSISSAAGSTVGTSTVGTSEELTTSSSSDGATTSETATIDVTTTETVETSEAVATSEPVATSEATSEVATGAESTAAVLQSSTIPTSSSTTPPQPAAQTVTRNLGTQTWAPFATFDDVTLVHPSIRIERIGFHESNHDGARQLNPAETAVNPLVLESRERGTESRTAADIVVEPGTEIRAPVTGTVIRAGGYILYCKHNDDFVVIEPDVHPGWEVKLLHISGVLVSPGDRVEAGVTVLAPAATPLPFDSQVDEFTAEPSWPHVHLELVDPSIPDRPSSGGGC